MRIEKHTCPFTGGEFEAVHMQESWIITHPLTGDTIRCPLDGPYLMVPLSALDRKCTMTPAEAADMLQVSRQRIDQLTAAGKLCQRYVNGSPVFLENDVVEYKGNRKNGRPRKE